jgi:hypothetical protein
MAQKLNIDIVARDKSKQALNSVQGALSKLRGAVFNLQNAFIGLGAGLVARNLVNTGKELENLRVRLKFLLKDTNEGAKAFDNMVKFASQVPFSLEEIQSGSGILATVTDNAKDLQQMLEITGNVAAVTGLDFRTTAEQIQRSFSAGIGAADLFREKGVRNMLGFKAGATVSIEQTVQAFEKVFGKGGRFGKATDELAQTFTGTLSMIGDKVFNFKKVLLEAGLFESLKKEFGALDKFLEENSKQIDSIAQDIGIALGFAVKKVADGIKLLKDNMDKFAIIIKGLIAIKVVSLFLSLAKAIRLAAKQMAKFSIASLLSVKGLKGIAVLVAKGGAFYAAFKGIDKLFEEIEENFNTFADGVKNSLPDARDLHKTYKGVAKEVEKVAQLTERERGLIANSKQELGGFENILRRMVGKSLRDFESKFQNIDKIVAEGILVGVRKISQSLAEAVVLGKNLFESFRALAQQILVNVLAHLIEQIALMQIQKLLKKDDVDKEAEKDNLIRKQNTNLKRQITLQAILMAMGGGGGGGSGISLFAKGGAVSKGQPIVVGEQGAELFIPNQTGQITQSARGTSGGGTTNVNFNINTVDASGFEELLVRSRGTITQLINNAVNERGKESLI